MRLILVHKGKLATALVIGAFSFTAGMALREKLNTPPTSPAPIATGTEMVLVFMATSSCPGVKDPDFPSAVRAISEAMRTRADESGMTFVTIGVSLDWDLTEGVDFLKRFGPFDEIAIGRGWLNMAAVRYIWAEFPGAASVPQILVLERDIVSDRTIEVNAERVRVRKVGAMAIRQWSSVIAAQESEPTANDDEPGI